MFSSSKIDTKTVIHEIDDRFIKAMTLIMFSHFCNQITITPEQILEKIAGDLEQRSEEKIKSASEGELFLAQIFGLDNEKTLEQLKEQIRSRKTLFASCIRDAMQQLAQGGIPSP